LIPAVCLSPAEIINYSQCYYILLIKASFVPMIFVEKQILNIMEGLGKITNTINGKYDKINN
jgi:hypothetical protein